MASFQLFTKTNRFGRDLSHRCRIGVQFPSCSKVKVSLFSFCSHQLYGWNKQFVVVVPLGFLCSTGTTFPVVSRKSLNQNWLRFLPGFSHKFWTLMLLSNESCEQLLSSVNCLLWKGQQSPPQSWQLCNVSAKGQISRNRFPIFSTVKCWNKLSR